MCKDVCVINVTYMYVFSTFSGVHSTEALKCYTCAAVDTTSVCYEGGTALEDEGSRYTSSCGNLDRCVVSDQRGTVNTNLSIAIHTTQHIPHALE